MILKINLPEDVLGSSPLELGLPRPRGLSFSRWSDIFPSQISFYSVNPNPNFRCKMYSSNHPIEQANGKCDLECLVFNKKYSVLKFCFEINCIKAKNR